jgi:hypothetical protein
VNNPLRYVDPTGEDWWNPFAVLGAALNAVGQALSKINPLDLLDSVMMVVGFIPGLDIISDAYSLLRAVIDVASGKGTWADVAMAAVFLLLPVGGSYFKAAKRASNVAEGATDPARVMNEAGDLAKGAKAVAKAEPSQLRNGKQYHKAFEQSEATSQAARGHRVGDDVLFNKGIPNKGGRGVGVDGAGRRVRPDEVQLHSDTIIEFKAFDEKAELLRTHGSQLQSYREAYFNARQVNPRIDVQTYFR